MDIFGYDLRRRANVTKEAFLPLLPFLACFAPKAGAENIAAQSCYSSVLAYTAVLRLF